MNAASKWDIYTPITGKEKENWFIHIITVGKVLKKKKHN